MKYLIFLILCIILFIIIIIVSLSYQKNLRSSKSFKYQKDINNNDIKLNYIDCGISEIITNQSFNAIYYCYSDSKVNFVISKPDYMNGVEIDYLTGNLTFNKFMSEKSGMYV